MIADIVLQTAGYLASGITLLHFELYMGAVCYMLFSAAILNCKV